MAIEELINQVCELYIKSSRHIGTSLAFAADIMKYKAPKNADPISTIAGIKAETGESFLAALGSIIINPQPMMAKTTPSNSF